MKQICLFFILALMVFSANSYAGLEDGLVSVWNFDDGTANDAVGDNDGEFMNGASTTDAEFGMALNLENPENPATGENTGQYVEIPSSSSLEKEDGVSFLSLYGSTSDPVAVETTPQCSSKATRSAGVPISWSECVPRTPPT